MDTQKLIRFYFLILSVFAASVLAKRSFSIVLESIECITNPKYISAAKCYIDKSSHPPSGFIDIQMQREITNKARYQFEVILLRNKIERVKLFSSKDNDICKFYEGKDLLKIVSIGRDVLKSFGEIPSKCPTNKDFHFVFSNLTVNPDQFPPYVPETEFINVVNVTEGQDLVQSVQVHGKVIQNKGWKL